MKKLILFTAAFFFASSFVSGQTATNFTANDCQGVSHDLYSELNAGKVVVLTWVMPCSSCVTGAQAAEAAAESFSVSHPGQVVHYVADDYANTNCAILGNWCTTNSVSPNAVFSTTLVNMSGYGAAGMPKVVVLGGSSHTVFYNVNNSAVNQSNIQTAISNALNTVTSLKEIQLLPADIKLKPNPANTEITLKLNGGKNLTIDIINVLGQTVKSVKVDNESEVIINTENLSNGSYFARLSNHNSSVARKFIVLH